MEAEAYVAFETSASQSHVEGLARITVSMSLLDFSVDFGVVLY